MTTADIVLERSLALAVLEQDEEEAVRVLLETAMGKRVALVLARQRIDEQVADIGAERAARATSLLDSAIATGDWGD